MTPPKPETDPSSPDDEQVDDLGHDDTKQRKKRPNRSFTAILAFAVVIVALIGGVVFFIRRRKRLQREELSRYEQLEGLGINN